MGLATATVAYAAPRIDAAKERDAARAARAAAAAAAAERARVASDQRPVGGRLDVRPDEPIAPRRRRIALRRAMVAAFESAVVDDARRRHAAGRGDGPVSGATCRPLIHTHGGASDELDPRKPVGRFECLAVTGEVRRQGRPLGTMGQPYVGSLRFGSGDYVLCRYHPPPGEGGVMLAQVPLDPSCFGARDAGELAALGIREAPRD